MSEEGVKNNFPPYDLPENSFLRGEVFTYYPIPNIDTYETLLKDNGFILTSTISGKTYNHYSGSSTPDISIIIDNGNGGSFEATISYKFNLNPSLLKAITPANVPLVQYQLLKHYVGERTFVINHIAKYKSDLVELGFEEIDEGIDKGEMKKEVGNCVYQWYYQHTDHYLNYNNGYINYNWIVYDKNS
jgi:hypothetical protein